MSETVVRTAEQPGQALNIDVCFVPEKHTAQEKLPSVSGSSGRLVVEHIFAEGQEPHWPGQVFGEADLDYEEAMRRYAEATRDRLVHSPSKKMPVLAEASGWRQRNERQMEWYRVKQQRKHEDRDWKTAKAERSQARVAFQALPRAERQRQQEAWQAADQAWRKVRVQRQETLKARQAVNEAWHQGNRELEQGLAATTEIRTWIAVLVVTDNCTRQCLGLPAFQTGAKLTSEELVAALRALLPKELLFLISDQGSHFRTKAFAQLAQECDFVHIPVYRHRPESNGIAERFVLTLKDWLRSQAWQRYSELSSWLTQFRPEYNDRPHQGLAIPGLSPDEFANRIWLT